MYIGIQQMEYGGLSGAHNSPLSTFSGDPLVPSPWLAS